MLCDIVHIQMKHIINSSIHDHVRIVIHSWLRAGRIWSIKLLVEDVKKGTRVAKVPEVRPFHNAPLLNHKVNQNRLLIDERTTKWRTEWVSELATGNLISLHVSHVTIPTEIGFLHEWHSPPSFVFRWWLEPSRSILNIRCEVIRWQYVTRFGSPSILPTAQHRPPYT